jgi:hypothetical protein
LRALQPILRQHDYSRAVLSDDDIDIALADVLPLDESLPDYAGTFLEAPYDDREGRAVLALGDHTFDLLIDRASGRLDGVPAEADAFLVNSSLDTFVRCVQAAVAAREEVERFEADGPPEEDDIDEDAEVVDEIEEIGMRLTARLREIDAAAMADDSGFWSVVAEELGYGGLP